MSLGTAVIPGAGSCWRSCARWSWPFPPGTRRPHFANGPPSPTRARPPPVRRMIWMPKGDTNRPDAPGPPARSGFRTCCSSLSGNAAGGPKWHSFGLESRATPVLPPPRPVKPRAIPRIRPGDGWGRPASPTCWTSSGGNPGAGTSWRRPERPDARVGPRPRSARSGTGLPRSARSPRESLRPRAGSSRRTDASRRPPITGPGPHARSRPMARRTPRCRVTTAFISGIT